MWDCSYKPSCVSIWKLIQKYRPNKISMKRKKINRYIVDETPIKIGSQYSWLWGVAIIEPKYKQILPIDISFGRTMLIVVAERFILSLIDKYGKHHISTADGDDGIRYPLQACKFLKLKHLLHSSFEKSIIEKTIQYVKDRAEIWWLFPMQKKEQL
jgi:putative transposase